MQVTLNLQDTDYKWLYYLQRRRAQHIETIPLYELLNELKADFALLHPG